MKKLFNLILYRLGWMLVEVQPPAKLVMHLQGKEWTTVLVDEAERLTVRGTPICIRVNGRPFLAVSVKR